MGVYVPRSTDPMLAEMLDEHPAVLVTGPRACGKTTSAMRHAATIVRLDVPARAAAFEADPDAALRAVPGAPILLDEWQDVPSLAGAIKRAVDADSTPGRFIRRDRSGRLSGSGHGRGPGGSSACR